MSQFSSGPRHSQTGQLDRRAILHKRYAIQRVIGKGGMGAVYLAKDLKRQGALYAIKEMSLSMVAPDEHTQAIQNFKVEAKILWGLNHPNLPTFVGFFHENYRYFLVMEYIEGRTLEDLLERNGKPFSERRVLGWARQLCDVMEYLHSQNPPIIFRDLKPGNIMLTRNNHMKLIDFGIARFFRPTHTLDTQHLGTPGYAPPEQYGTMQTDERADIYSLGMTLFHLLTNTLSETGFGLKDIRNLYPYISPVVARALEKATSLEPNDRYASVSAFRSALLGVGFVFDSGDLATNPQELADLCLRYPEEAADYLAAGEIEAWLHELGENKLARESERIRLLVHNPITAVENFIQIVHYYALPHKEVDLRLETPAPEWDLPQENVDLTFSPRALDFGSLPATTGFSQPETLNMFSNQPISGLISASEPWLIIDPCTFSGQKTTIQVRVNTLRLRSAQEHSATIVFKADTTHEEWFVNVQVEIVGSVVQSRGRRMRTVNADLDDDDDEDSQEIPVTSQVLLMLPSLEQAEVVEEAPPSHKRMSEKTPFTSDQQKYPLDGTGVWEPVQMTTRQRLWYQRIQTVLAAFLFSSLSYMFLNQWLPVIPPSPFFIAVLMGIIPTSALGAVLSTWQKKWSKRAVVNHFAAAMASCLPALAFTRLIWQVVGIPEQGGVELVVMMTIAAVATTVGLDMSVYEMIFSSLAWALARFRRGLMIIGGIFGGLLGYLFFVGIGLNCLTPLGVGLGMAVAVLLVWRAEQMLKWKQKK